MFDVFGREAKEAPAQRLDELSEGEYPEGPVVVTDGDFDAATERFPVVVVDCWAPWCMPCRMLGPVIEELAGEYKGRIVFGKLNVDENPRIAVRFGIRSIPSLLVFRNGVQVDRFVGVMSRRELEERLKPYVE